MAKVHMLWDPTKKRTASVLLCTVNVSPMSPKLFLSYPHREEYREINLATLVLWLVLLKLLCNQLKIFVNLTFSQKVWLFHKKFDFLFCFDLLALLSWEYWKYSCTAAKKKWLLVLLWQKCQIFKVNYLWLKKFNTKINAILLISELMASFRKVLRHFHRHGEIFTILWGHLYIT